MKEKIVQDDLPYDFELDRVIRNIERVNAKRVLLQFPEGLIQYSLFITDFLEERTGAELFVVGEGSYGACDVAFSEAELLDADLIVHFGHNRYVLQRPWVKGFEKKTLYIPARSRIQLKNDLLNNLYSLLDEKGYRKPLLTASIQHSHLLVGLYEKLGEIGLSPIIDRIPGMNLGQVLGCDYRLIKRHEGDADSIIIVSGGGFHVTGALLATMIPVVHVDPYEDSVKDVTHHRKTLLGKRYMMIEKARGEGVWAVWIGSRYSQYRSFLAKRIVSSMKKKGIKHYIIISRTASPMDILNLASSGIRVHVITSCPRIPIDDSDKVFGNILLTPGEALMITEEGLGKYIFPW